MKRNELLKRIEDVEGRKYKMYMLDGIPHIGIGHNIISRSLADETLDFLGIEDEPDLMTAELNDEQCDYLLGKDLDIAIADAVSVMGEEVFTGLTDDRQDVLVDMSFNLGRPRFSKFKQMIDAVQEGDFDEAADQILDSNAARDPKTKTRYENLANEMRGEQISFVEASTSLKETDLSETATIQLFEDAKDILQELARRCK